MTKPNPTDAKDSVFNPQQLSAMTVAEIKRRKAGHGAGIVSSIPRIKDDLLPYRPGEMIVVLGYTSNYKSGLMMFEARHAVEQIKRDPNQIIIYVTWEQSVEEHGMLELAAASKIDASQLAQGKLNKAEWKDMMSAAVDRAISPLWLIGHSSSAGKRRPRLSMTDLGQALEFIVDEKGKQPALICLDYAQRIRAEGGYTRREQMMEIVDRTKDMALAFSCPVMLGTQSGRQVNERDWKLPQVSDGQETSNLEQSADKMLSVWMPKNNEPPGSTIGDPPIKVNDNLLYIGIIKQKFGKAPVVTALHVDASRNEIHAMETRSNEPEPHYPI